MAISKDKKRIGVTVPQPVYAALLGVSDVTGISISSICAQFLTEALPAIQQMRDALVLAKTDQAQAYDKLATMLSTSQLMATQAQLEIIEERAKIRRTSGKGRRRSNATSE